MRKLFLTFLVFVSFLQVSSCPVNAGAQDFTIKKFEANYYLSRDDDGQSVLRTVEKITVEFPNFDQNHGIERGLPLSYDGHITSLQIVSIKNEIDTNLTYKTYESNDNLVLRIGDADRYVYGMQTYVITYTQKNVTKFFSDTNDDEFYWDVNGFGWSQKFERITARVYLDSDLVDKISLGESCYYGFFNENKVCNIDFVDGVYTATVDDLDIGENMTIAIAFKPKTFSAYKTTFKDYFIKYVGLISIGLSFVVALSIVSMWLLKGRSSKGRGTIVPEYLPPMDTDIILAAAVMNRENWLASAYVDMAVRHKIKIIEIEKKFLQRQSYNIELMSTDGLTVNEKIFLSNVFGDSLQVGSKYTINPNKPDYEMGRKMASTYMNARRSAVNEGYYRDIKKLKITMSLIMAVGFAALVLDFVFADPAATIGYGWSKFLLYVFCGIAVAVILTIKPLSESGKLFVEYLDGLKMYIKTAEADRLNYLQSVSGAEKIDINDKAKLVKLYEKILPYAILFGLEKSWEKVIGNYYLNQNSQPDWYFGTGTFNSTTFVNTVSNFSSVAKANSYTSSGGGSGGGGFSGGGGGGGGGGGW